MTLPNKRVELVDGETFVVLFPYEAVLVAQIKELVPAARWDKTRVAWTAPARLGSAEGLLKFAAAHRFAVSPAAADKARAIVQAHAGRLEASRAETGDFASLGIAHRLPAGLMPAPFQVAGIHYALDTQRMIFGDEPGLGKTIQALLTALAANAFPLLVICPAGLVYNWENEARKWLRGKTVSVIASGRRNSYYADVVIIGYDLLSEREERGAAKRVGRGQKKDVPLSVHARELLKLGHKAIVFDEIHYLKNYKAKRTMAAKELAKGAAFRLGLSGTLAVNRPAELISPLQLIGRLDDLGGFFFFVRRYCEEEDGGSGYGLNIKGAKNLGELNEKLRKVCYVRREKKDVRKELPAKVRTLIPVDIDNPAEYARVEGDVAGWFAERKANDRKFLAELDARLDRDASLCRMQGWTVDAIAEMVTTQRAKAIAERQKTAAGSASRAEQLLRFEALKTIATRGILREVVERVRDITTTESMILFASHIEIQHALLKEFPDAHRILGADDAVARQAAVDKFQQVGGLMIASLNAAGVGWTGTKASTVAFVELGWTPAVHDQAEDRAHRMGQVEEVNALYFIARNTIVEDNWTLIETKRAIVTAVNVGDEVADKVATVDAMLAGINRRAGQPALV